MNNAHHILVRVQRVGLADGLYTDRVLLDAANFEWVFTSGPLYAAGSYIVVRRWLLVVTGGWGRYLIWNLRKRRSRSQYRYITTKSRFTRIHKIIHCGYYRNVIVVCYNTVSLTENGNFDAIETRRFVRPLAKRRHFTTAVKHNNYNITIPCAFR